MPNGHSGSFVIKTTHLNQLVQADGWPSIQAERVDKTLTWCITPRKGDAAAHVNLTSRWSLKLSEGQRDPAAIDPRSASSPIPFRETPTRRRQRDAGGTRRRRRARNPFQAPKFGIHVLHSVTAPDVGHQRSRAQPV